MFIGCVIDEGANFTQDSGHGWATPPNAATSSGPSVSVAGGNQVNSGVGTLTFAPTLNVAVAWAAFIVGFRPLSGGGFLAIL
jgi:hypothetical protein